MSPCSGQLHGSHSKDFVRLVCSMFQSIVKQLFLKRCKGFALANCLKICVI